MTVRDICNLINSFAPFETQMNGDNSGFLVGSAGQEVSAVLFALDVTEPDLVVCLHPVAYARYAGKIGDALLLYNSDEVTPDESAAGPQKGLAITHMAKELGNPQTANILTMGAIAALTQVITPEGAKEAIRKFFKGKSDKVIALNEKAFDLGYEKGIELREER